MNKSQIFFINYLKVFSIILICGYHFSYINDMYYSHNLTYLTIFNRFIFGFNSLAVPIFFMINGALLFNREFELQKQLSRIKKISFNF